MNKQHLYTTLFLALSSAYLSACSSTAASDTPRLSEAQQKQLASERAGHLRQTDTRFKALDRDKNGSISRAEWDQHAADRGVDGHHLDGQRHLVLTDDGCKRKGGCHGKSH